MTTLSANEKDTAEITGTLYDQDSAVIPGSALEAVLVSSYPASTPETLQRSADDLLSNVNFSVDESGVFTWNLTSFDTQIIDPAATAIGSAELQRLILEFYWNSAATGGLTDPFDTTLDSTTVVVTHVAHGLATRDHVVFVGSGVTVGGLDLDGNYVITRIDADSYSVEHQTAASSTATGGGSVTFFANPESRTEKINLKITRLDPV